MEGKKLNSRQKPMVKARGLNPDDYVVIRDLYGSLWLKNVRTGQIKIINKKN